MLVRLIDEDEALFYFIDKRLDVMIEYGRRIIELCAGRVDAIWMGEDLGFQRGPLISLTLFEEHVRPRLQLQ